MCVTKKKEKGNFTVIGIRGWHVPNTQYNHNDRTFNMEKETIDRCVGTRVEITPGRKKKKPLAMVGGVLRLFSSVREREP